MRSITSACGSTPLRAQKSASLAARAGVSGTDKNDIDPGASSATIPECARCCGLSAGSVMLIPRTRLWICCRAARYRDGTSPQFHSRNIAKIGRLHPVYSGEKPCKLRDLVNATAPQSGISQHCHVFGARRTVASCLGMQPGGQHGRGGEASSGARLGRLIDFGQHALDQLGGDAPFWRPLGFPSRDCRLVDAKAAREGRLAFAEAGASGPENLSGDLHARTMRIAY